MLGIGAAAFALPSLRGLWAGDAAAPNTLAPVADASNGLPLLRLREGFSYRSFSWAGDVMAGGGVVPGRHDGMAAVPAADGGVTLLRNHEEIIGAPIGRDGTPVYDAFALPPGTEGAPDGFPGFGGGVTGVSYTPGREPSTVALLAGTAVNCAGGPTGWGSWLTCEEVVLRASRIGARDHGYVFEVPAVGAASGRPIVDMGLFRHEAAAVDPATGIVYLTEDNSALSGFYRFLPRNRQPRAGALEEGGQLEMLRVRGTPNADLRAPARGDEYEVDWVPVPEPDRDPETFAPGEFGGDVLGMGKSGPYQQGEAAGGARFARGEGAWEHGGSIYWVDTAGGPAGAGSVWVYEPAKSVLRALYVSPREAVADAPDNITVHANGLVLACEDGGGVHDAGELVRGTRLLALGRDGRVVEVGENNIVLDGPVPGRPVIPPGDYRGAEWAGATFSPDGDTLFVNIQTPGITFAIAGPWDALAAGTLPAA